MSKKSNKNSFPKRSLSRLIAVQIFYQYEFYDREIPVNVLTNRLVENYFLSEEEIGSSYLNKIDEELLHSLISGLGLVESKIDREINLFLKDGWKIEGLSNIVLQILRFATFELQFMKDIPTKVIINEYVDLSACFYDAKQVTFVNSILQNIANNSRPLS